MPMPVGSGFVSIPTSSRTFELSPSAPTSRSYTPTDSSFTKTSTPASVCSRPVTFAPNRTVRAGLLGVGEQDAREIGARHAHRGRVVGAARLDVGQLRDDRSAGARGAQVRAPGRRSPASRIVVPRAERVEDPQGVALQRDPRAECAELGLRLEDVDLDAGLGELDRGGERGHSASGDGDLVDCGHVRTSLFSCVRSDLEDRDGVDGRTYRAGDRQRCGGEKEVVTAGCGARRAELLEVPHLADRETEVGDHDLVQRLEGGHVELVGRTSKPHVSVAIAAISVRCSHPAVVSERPGAGPPA